MLELVNLICSEKHRNRGIVKGLRKTDVFLLPSNLDTAVHCVEVSDGRRVGYGGWSLTMAF